jgi:hypothetical protein
MNPFFKTQRVPALYQLDNKLYESDKDIIINTETKEQVGVVSKDYKLVENNEVNDLFIDAFNKYSIERTQDFILKGGEKWKRRIIFNDDELQFEILPSDSVGVMLEIYNSYNGKTSVGMEISSFRWACENGMVFGKQNLFKISCTHAKHNLDKIQAQFNIGKSSVNNVIPIWKKWTEEKFENNEIESFVNTRKYLTDKGKERALIELDDKRQQDKLYVAETKWMFFNLITSIMTHDITARRNDTSSIFTNKYRQYEKMANDLYTFDTKALN